MTEEQLFVVAKIIDNEYIGSEKTFISKRLQGYWFLSTNKCDMASNIKIWEKNNKISSIQRLGPDTEGWQDIQPGTWGRIEKYLDTLNAKPEKK